MLRGGVVCADLEAAGAAPSERFPAKWMPLRIKKAREFRMLEQNPDSG